MKKEIVIKFDAETGEITSKVQVIGEQIESVKNKANKAAEDTGKSFNVISNKIGQAIDQFTGGIFGQIKTMKEGVQAAIPAFKDLRGAIIATGIGAAIVGLGLLVTHFDQIKDFFRDKSREDALKRENERIASSTALMREQVELLKARGAAREDVFAREEQILQSLIRQKDNEISINAILGDEEKTLAAIEEKRRATLDLQILQTTEEERRLNILDKARQNIDAEYKAQSEQAQVAKEEKQLLANVEKEIASLLKFQEEIQRRINKYPEGHAERKKEEAFYAGQIKEDAAELLRLQGEQKLLQESINKQDEEFAKKKEEATTRTHTTRVKQITDEANLKKKFVEEEVEEEEDMVGGIPIEMQMRWEAEDADLARRKQREEEWAEWYDNHIAGIIAIDGAAAEKKIADEKAVRDARISFAFATSAALKDIAEVLAGDNEKRAKKAFALTKALNLAEAIANTYTSITAVLKDPTTPPAAKPFLIAASVATGLAAVAKIAATKFESKTPPSSPPPGGIDPPSGDSGGMNLTPNFGFLQQGANQNSIQAYVLESNVTNSQQANQKIKDQSVL